jgi:hypothetical protein
MLGAFAMPPPPCSSGPSRLLPSLTLYSRRTVAATTAAAASSPAPAGGHGRSPLRYAVLGAGFAGLSVAWHLLKVPHLLLSPPVYGWSVAVASRIG